MGRLDKLGRFLRDEKWLFEFHDERISALLGDSSARSRDHPRSRADRHCHLQRGNQNTVYDDVFNLFEYYRSGNGSISIILYFVSISCKKILFYFLFQPISRLLEKFALQSFVALVTKLLPILASSSSPEVSQSKCIKTQASGLTLSVTFLHIQMMLKKDKLGLLFILLKKRSSISVSNRPSQLRTILTSGCFSIPSHVAAAKSQFAGLTAKSETTSKAIVSLRQCQCIAPIRTRI